MTKEPIAEQFVPIIARALREGWTSQDLYNAFEQKVEEERERMMNAVSEQTYRSNH